MNNPTILVIFGTRPEAIKMCPLVKKIKENNKISCKVCLTGQHREMLYPVMEAFHIKEDYNLDIMSARQTLSDITTKIITSLTGILTAEKPDLILVHGDTTTSFAAALSGFYMNIPVGHVEAGLRTHDMYSPYPEEFNRQAVDLISNLYFAPTENAKKNLLEEGKKEESIFVTGNTVIDALTTTVQEDYTNPHLEWASDSKLILFTAHRRENLGEQMRAMFRAIKRIVAEFHDVKVLYPVHMNPKVREVANAELDNNDRIRLIEPLNVIDFHNFMARSYLILTDSGGIQEEAPALGKPVLVMRDTTERPEGIMAGTLRLVGTNEERIYQETKHLLTNQEAYRKMSHAVNPYGDGHASERIVEAIIKYLEKE